MKGDFHREGFRFFLRCRYSGLHKVVSPHGSKLTHPGLASATRTVPLSSLQARLVTTDRLLIIHAASTQAATAGCPLVWDAVVFLGMANFAKVLSADGIAKVQSMPSSKFQICAQQLLR